MVKLREKTAIERFLPDNPAWAKGYQEFTRLLGKASGWLYILHEDGHRIARFDRKGNLILQPNDRDVGMKCLESTEKRLIDLETRETELVRLPRTYRCAYHRMGVIFALNHLGRPRGFLVLCGIGKSEQRVQPHIKSFNYFLESQIELAYKSFELQNFYETVHPRALALSTIHSVHRAMASSHGLDELLPRVCRLCAQVLKAKKGAIYLLDSERKYLIPKFSFGEEHPRKRRLKVGTGLEGHVADTAEFHLSRKCISVPFIEDDVVGIVILRDKIGDTPFTKTDLEILKTLAEQAVVAIKNAQLFEETERLTLSSIKTINELLELNFSGDNVHLPLFSDLTFQIGRDLGLTRDEITNLHRATYLIDAGHLGTPEHILRKKEKLTREEFKEVMQHPHRGASVLSQISSLRPVIPIILHHHERYDGTGYPDRLKGEEIPVGARIVAVVDSFTAMLSPRPYRRIKELDDAIQEVKKNSGTQYDPKVVESFLRVVEQPEMYRRLKEAASNGSKGIARPARH